MPSLEAGRFARSVKMKSKYLAERDLSKCGHALVPVEIDWSVFPDSAVSGRKKMTSSTCKHCWIISRGGYKGRRQCRGAQAKLRACQVRTWLKMRHTVNAAPLLKVWGVTEAQAAARFRAAATSAQKHEFEGVSPTGHDWTTFYVSAKDYYPETARKCTVVTSKFGLALGAGSLLRTLLLGLVKDCVGLFLGPVCPNGRS